MRRTLGVSAAAGLAALVAFSLSDTALAASDEPIKAQDSTVVSSETTGTGLSAPAMDPARGRKLFAAKGCVVCHAINGVGGRSAPALDASAMPGSIDPFDFAARMWRGAEAMTYMQRDELGEQITFTGGELADIVAFVHDAGEQKRFSIDDVPPRIAEIIHHADESDP